MKMRLIIGILSLLASAGAARADGGGFYDAFHSIDSGRWYSSNGWVNGDHQACEWRADAFSTNANGLQMEISDRGGAVRPLGCPEMHTTDVSGYGVYEARMRTSAGSGLNTTIFTYVGPPTGSKEHDEIDFEFLGKDPHSVQINYFANGQGHHKIMIPLGFDASQAMHNYAIEWAPHKIKWYVDGKLVHETPDDAALPRNPPRFYLSLWAGSEIEDAWLGHFVYRQPVTAEIEWAAFTPAGQPCQFPQSAACGRP